MRLLQVCNVGNILGGTAACAWSVARALPQVEHGVVFLSSITDETRRVFSDRDAGSVGVAVVEQWDRIDDERLKKFEPEVVLLHNTPVERVGRIASAMTIQYMHSAGRRAEADLTVYCSRWLADRGSRPGAVLYQGVPKPPRPLVGDTRELRSHLVVGRICTPLSRKWPVESPEFYARLARTFPEIAWEFVGCPAELQPRLMESCSGRAVFHPASWSARAHLWRWDALLYHNPHVTESFGRTAAEAMRAGCMPIVDARGGFAEQVAEGCGFLCRDESDFEAAIDRLQSSGERRRMSRRAMVHADDRFGLARFAIEMRRLFEACCVGNRNAH